MHCKLTVKVLFFILATGFIVLVPLGVSRHHNTDNATALKTEISKSYAAPTGTYSNYPSITTRVLQTGYDARYVNNGRWIQKLYNLSRSIVNILLVAILMIYAFANILNFNIDTYSIKKTLPKIVFVAIVANLSLPLITLASAAVDSLQSSVHLFSPAIMLWPGWGVAGWYGASMSITLFAILSYLLGGPKAFSIILCCTGLLFPLVAGILIAFILDFRPYVIWLATGIAPIAIACSLLPQTEGAYKKWIKILSVWLVTPVVIYALIHIAYLIPTATAVAGDKHMITSMVGVYLPLVLRFGIILLAVRVPFMLDKDVASIIAKVGNFVGKQALALPAAVGYWGKSPGITQAISDARQGSGVFRSAPQWLRNSVVTGGGHMRGAGQFVTNPADYIADRARTRIGGWEHGLMRHEWARRGLDAIPSAALWSELPTIMKTEQEVRQKASRDNVLENTNLQSLVGSSTVMKIRMEQSKGNTEDQSFDVLQNKATREIGRVTYRTDEDGNQVVNQVQEGRYTRILRDSVRNINPTMLEAVIEQQGLQGRIGDFLIAEGSRGTRTDNDGNVINLPARYRMVDGNTQQGLANNVELAHHYIDFMASTGSKAKNGQYSDALMQQMLIEGQTTTDLTDLREVITSLKRKSGQTRPPRSSFASMQIDAAERRRLDDERQNNRENNQRERRQENNDAWGGGSAYHTEGHDDPDDLVGDLTGRALERQSVELANPDAIATAIASQGGIKADVSELVSASNQNFTSAIKDLQTANIGEEQIKQTVAGYRNGSIHTPDDLQKALPTLIAEKYGEVHKKLSRAEMQRSLALHKAAGDPQAEEVRNLVERLIPKFDELKASNGQPLKQAAITIQMHESGTKTTSPETLVKMKQVIADALRVNATTINAGIATKAAEAYDLLNLRERTAK